MRKLLFLVFISLHSFLVQLKQAEKQSKINISEFSRNPIQSEFKIP
jgi:hypothetical protein